MDFRFLVHDFASTEITVEAISDNGKALLADMFGKGAVSINLPKSKGFDFETFVIRKGFSVA